MEDPKRIIPSIAIAFLVLVLMPLRMVTAGELPRLTPSTEEELEEFFKDKAKEIGKEIADLVPSQGSNGGGQRRRQAPATHFSTLSYRYQMGTPPRSVTGALDISSELVRTQCVTPTTRSSTMAVVQCWSDTCHNFVGQSCSADGSRSQPCSYIYRGSKASTTGYLATESFTFGATRVDHLVFGCDDRDSVIGLGRGRDPLSLASTLGRFSYYLAPNDDSSSGDTQSFILFGDDATRKSKGAWTTQLLPSDNYPNSYLVGLTGIRVDGKDLGIQRGTFSGGVVLSITVPITLLAQSAYNLLKEALVSSIGLPVRSTLGLDVCYATTVKIPSMELVFDYGNAVMELEVGNYFFLDANSRLACLTILPSPDGDVSLLGSLIQAGTHMIYDIRGSTLTFESLSSGSPPHILPLLVLFANFLCVAYMIM